MLTKIIYVALALGFLYCVMDAKNTLLATMYADAQPAQPASTQFIVYQTNNA